MASDIPDDDLTEEEWAELERATAPESPARHPGESTETAEMPAASSTDPAFVAEDAASRDRAASSDEVVSNEEVGPPLEVVDTTTTSMAGASLVAVPAAAPSQQSAADSAVPESTTGAAVLGASVAAAAEAAEARASSDEADDAPESHLAMPLPRILAVANQKGGVGKTTTTVNIAACLAEQGYRTLLVDLDPQANASTGLGLEPRELEYSIYHVMLHDQDADSVIEPTEVKNLFVLPSSLDLAGAEIELVALLSREHRLRLAIESVIDDYDYVLIDCPPSLGLLTINALTAANEVLVPIQCEYYALEGLGQLMRNVELVRASLNPKLQISHIVLVMFDPRTKLAGQVVDEVRSHFGPTVCDNVIPRTVRLSEAPSFGQPITTFDSGSRGASAYRSVTQEVIRGQA